MEFTIARGTIRSFAMKPLNNKSTTNCIFSMLHPDDDAAAAAAALAFSLLPCTKHKGPERNEGGPAGFYTYSFYCRGSGQQAVVAWLLNSTVAENGRCRTEVVLPDHQNPLARRKQPFQCLNLKKNIVQPENKGPPGR